MAPEQAIGDPTMDHRADLYSWGLVAYEVLAGRHPFAERTTPQALVTAHLTEPPPPLGEVATDRPWLASLVLRTLEKNRDDRPATAKEVVDALTAGNVTETVVTRRSTPSVAVLPFANLSGQADDEYFSDGMTEEAINAIGRIPGVRVAARTSSFAFKGQRLDLRTIAQQLRVETILEGSVRRAGTRVRIAVQLVSAADGLHLWSERFDRELSDIFALQDEIGSAIARALRERFGSASLVTPPERAIRGVVDPTAYDHYLRGRFLFEQHSPLEALTSFERAVEIDPSFALAHAWCGSAVIFAANLGLLPPSLAYPRGKRESELLLVLDPTVAEGYVLGAICALWYDWDYPRAERMARRAVELSPNDPHAHEFVAWSLLAQQRAAEGVVSMEKSHSLDPMSEFRLHTLCLIYSLAGMPARAIELLRPALARSPGNGYLRWTLGVALLTLDRPAEARVEYERARELMTITNFPAAGLSCALSALGDLDAARRMLDEARTLAEQGRGSKSEVAIAYHWLGDDERALAWFEQAIAARDMFVTLMPLDPRVRKLRETPAFQQLLRRVP
jgi:serine/threonine-protein kinase